MLYTNKDVAGVAIVTASVALVKLTRGINNPLFVAVISSLAEKSGVLLFIPTLPDFNMVNASARAISLAPFPTLKIRSAAINALGAPTGV